MDKVLYCPQCGAAMPADSPQGVCPKCLIGLGLSSNLEAGQGAETLDSSGRFTPPKPHELAAHFPQLEILDLIGVGGMGAVYKARQLALDRLVALKILPPEASRDPAFAERFSREAKALARLNHTHIVSVYDSGQAGGLYYFLMEYVDGINLREAIQTGELGPQEALAIVPQVCDALEYAHEAGIVHRDIKPENVLLDKKGGVKIADFGLARLLGQAGENFTLTGTHQVMGTPRYMAPEQMEGSHEVDHRADIYSLGVVFYEMLTGELPLGRFALPSRKVQVDVRLDDVVLRTLEKEPERRYQQVSELKSDVETISGLGSLPPHIRRMYGYEYRSRTLILGWPLVHIATGTNPRTGKKRVARGIIAIGDIAIGLLALGGVSMGGVAFGGCAVGLITLGGASLGLLLAFGGGAIGLGLSMGGLAIGSVAIGGLAIGVVAYGGEALGIMAYGANAQDPAVLHELGALGRVLPWVHFLLPAGAILVTLIAAAVLAISRHHAEGRQTPRSKQLHSGPGRVSCSGAGCAVLGGIFLLLLTPCVFGLLASAYWRLSGVRRDRAAATSVASGTSIDLQDSLLLGGDNQLHLVQTAEGPRICDWFARSLGISSQDERKINEILRSTHVLYLELERDHLQQSTNLAGHQITQVPDFSTEVERLEHQLWSQLDELLDVDQQRTARENLEIYPLEVHDQDQPPERFGPGLLGWGPQGAFITIWRVGTWYHWNVSRPFPDTLAPRPVSVEGRAPELPVELRRYFSQVDR